MVLFSGAFRTAIVTVSIVAGSLGAATHSWSWPAQTRPAVPAEATQVVVPVTPQLASKPLRVAPESSAGPIVTVAGRDFTANVEMTLKNQFNEFTFGPQSLTRIASTAFQFDSSPVPAGAYVVTVRNGAGRPSNPVTLVVVRN